MSAPGRPRRGTTLISRVARSTNSSRIRTSIGPVTDARTETGPAVVRRSVSECS